MQFAIVTDSGFRFALAHFPVKTMPAVTLLEKFWEGIEHCERAGFRQDYIQIIFGVLSIKKLAPLIALTIFKFLNMYAGSRKCQYYPTREI